MWIDGIVGRQQNIWQETTHDRSFTLKYSCLSIIGPPFTDDSIQILMCDGSMYSGPWLSGNKVTARNQK
jgi:hypothetical protein